MKRFGRKADRVLLCAFLALEAVLYACILLTDGDFLRATSYLSIVLCFVYALLHLRRDNALVVGGLLCTVGADFCLVVCSPIQQLYGMLFFLVAQTLYAVWLYRRDRNRPLLLVRAVLIVLVEGVAVWVLGDALDALAVVSVCYYVNLVVNILAAFWQRKRERVLPIALCLFLLCDTVIGLQVAAGGYLPIAEDSLLYRILFMDFNLSWFFYLPSQVLIALCGSKREEQNI